MHKKAIKIIILFLFFTFHFLDYKALGALIGDESLRGKSNLGENDYINQDFALIPRQKGNFTKDESQPDMGEISPKELPVSLSLDEALRIACSNSLDIKLAIIDTQHQREELGIAGSIFDTILSAEINYEDEQLAKGSSLSGTKNLTNNYNFGLSRRFKSGTVVEFDFENERSHSNSPFASLKPAHTSQTKVTFTQPLAKNFFGLIDQGDLLLAQLDIEKTDFLSLERIEELLAQVEIDYWGLALAQEEVKIKKEMLEQAKKLYHVYSERFSRGTAERSDLLASEANFKIRKIALREAENKVDFGENLLKLRLNLDNPITVRAADALRTSNFGSDFISNLKEAICARRDYQRTLKDIESKDVKVTLKKNSLWPQVDLVASFAQNGIDTSGSGAIEKTFNENNPELYLGLSLEVPLERSYEHAQYNQAVLDKEKALLTLKKLEMEIVREMDDKVREVNFSLEKIKEWAKIIELHAIKLNEEERRIQHGRSSSDILIRFQDDLLNSWLNLAQAHLEYRVSKVKLNLAKNIILTNLKQENILE